MLDQHDMKHELELGHSGYVVSFEDVDGIYSTIFIGLVSDPLSLKAPSRTHSTTWQVALTTRETLLITSITAE